MSAIGFASVRFEKIAVPENFRTAEVASLRRDYKRVRQPHNVNGIALFSRDTAGQSRYCGLAQEGQKFRFGASYRGPIAVVTCFRVFGDLFGRFKIHLVDGVLIELAITGRVIATDLGAGVINSAPVVGLKMFARSVDEQIPHVVFHKHARAIVEQVPTHEVEILFARRFFNGKCEVAAAFRGAIIAEGVAAWDFFTLWDSAVDGFGGG